MALTRITKGVIKPNEDYQTGIITATGLDVNGNADISGSLSVSGVLTYEDVTSIDSVGIITAQSDIHVGGGVSAVGVGTFGGLDINGDLDVDGHTNLDNVSVAGVTTMSGNLTISNTDPQLAIHDTNHNPSHYYLKGVDGAFKINDSTNGDRLTFNANGSISVTASVFNIVGGAQVSTNLGVTGNLILTDNIIHDGDTNTKIRFPAADTFSVETAGSERLRITSGGRVFIGESSVAGSANLVVGNGGAENFELTSGAASTYEGGVLEYIHRGDGNTRPNLNYYVNNTGAHKFWTGGSERLRITSTGKLGINAASPVGNLQVMDTSSNVPLIRIETSDGGNKRLDLKVESSDGVISCEQSAQELHLKSTSNTTFSTNSSERLRIDSSGRVIIGATSVSPATSYTDNLVVSEASANAGIQIIGNNSNSNYATFGLGDAGGNLRSYLEAQLGANGNFTIGTAGSGAIRFTNSGGERLRITSGGQVCIGTDTAVRALTIKQPGQIHLESTDTGNWLGVSLKGSSGTNNYNAYFGMLDSNGNFFIDNGSNGNDFVINQSGQVTKPNQPIFDVCGASGNPSGAGYITFTTVKVNIGSHYSTGTGKFIAPVAGTYFFSFGCIKAGNNNLARLYLYKNGSSANGRHLRMPTGGDGYGENGAKTNIVTLAANDEIQVYMSEGTVHGGTAYLYFNGYLIG